MPLGVEQVGRAFAHRAKRGLYAGRRVLFGNRVSEDGGNRSRRKWLPNAQKKRIFSETLGYMVPLRVTTGALRNIDKAGGLDAYLSKIEGTREDTEKGAQLREQLQKSEQIREQQRAQSLLAQDRRRQKAEASLLPPAAVVLEEPQP